MRRAALLLAICAACGGAPSIHSFTVDRSPILRGDTATLSWNVEGATKLELQPEPGTVTGSSLQVSPELTTSYTLRASNSTPSSQACGPRAAISCGCYEQC